MISQFIDVVLHMDSYLALWISLFGGWIYVILFFIVFAETGLVVTPFLPGDSLLFALGALAAIPRSGLQVETLAIVLLVAAFVGDNVNYWIGRFLGPKVFARDKHIFFSRTHLEKTQAFYKSHGGKTIIMARFMPIVRTFAPFVAGIGKMPYFRYLGFSVAGAFLWIPIFLGAGYAFGNAPAVKSHFHLVIFAVIGLSVLPLVWKAYKK